MVGVPVAVGIAEVATDAQGYFELSFEGVLPGDAVYIHGNRVGSNLPFIAEKIDLLLGREVYPQSRNDIPRPIYLPTLDIANGNRIDPTVDTTVTTSAIPGAAVSVAANSLKRENGEPFDGILSITEGPC